jgi:hypothetical protein
LEFETNGDGASGIRRPVIAREIPASSETA